MEKEIKSHFKISFVLSAIAYTLSGFVKWDLLWMSDIGSWPEKERGHIIFYCVIIHLFAFIVRTIFNLNK